MKQSDIPASLPTAGPSSWRHILTCVKPAGMVGHQDAVLPVIQFMSWHPFQPLRKYPVRMGHGLNPLGFAVFGHIDIVTTRRDLSLFISY